MLWYKLPWRYIVWGDPVPEQAKFQDLFNLTPELSKQSPATATRNVSTEHHTMKVTAAQSFERVVC